MNGTGPLRLPLLANAAFSALSGFVLLFGGDAVARALGPEAPHLYRFLGAGLLGFAGALAASSLKPRPLWVVPVLVADVAWVLATTACLAIWWSAWTRTGVAAISLTNGVVTVLAFQQARGVLEVFSVSGDRDRFEVCVRVSTAAELGRLWPVVSDLGSIADHMPSLASSTLEGDARRGAGAVRTCTDTRGRSWSERCVRWDEDGAFDVRFLADEPSFPFPFTDMIGGWRLLPRDGGCDVEVWWRVVPRQRWLAPLLLPVMAHGAAQSFGEVVASMVARAQGDTQRGAPSRLRAAFC